MKLNDNDKQTFWSLANTWASSTLDTPKRATMLLDFVEELRGGAFLEGLNSQRKPGGKLTEFVDTMARDAAEGLAAIEEQQAKRERRLAEEQRREVDRRKAGA